MERTELFPVLHTRWRLGDALRSTQSAGHADGSVGCAASLDECVPLMARSGLTANSQKRLLLLGR